MSSSPGPGAAHLAANELGPAVLNLERAARLSDDDDIAANLAVARERQVDQVVGSARWRSDCER